MKNLTELLDFTIKLVGGSDKGRGSGKVLKLKGAERCAFFFLFLMDLYSTRIDVLGIDGRGQRRNNGRAAAGPSQIPGHTNREGCSHKRKMRAARANTVPVL